jgi:polyprenyl P-hydroxybenzoate/phenylacrylic acid decarboxylase-like protein
MSAEFIVGVTGASGSAVTLSLLRALLRQEQVTRVHLICSSAAMPVMAQELGIADMDARALVQKLLDGDKRAPIASGSYRAAGMVIAPCSMNTLAAVSQGLADNLMTRAADVTLKERRPLLMAVRETPLSAVHLENMLRATRNGSTIFPLCPAFYAHPDSVEEMLDNFVLRLLDHLGLTADRGYRWGTPPSS